MTAGISHIDPDRLRRIGALDDPAVWVIITRFLTILDGRITALAQAAEEGRTADLVAELHQLRGSAATCGFPAIAALCSRAEAAPEEFDAKQLRSLAASATAAITEFRASE